MTDIKHPPYKREDKEEFELNHTAPWAIKSKDATRLYEKDICEYRTHFQRDRDRIIHSKAFRRLMYKTQVYMTLEGDHYRNRLSHTLEVTQIACSIATSLGLNVDLVEAIALGHDLGHTPFGHTVEEVLNQILDNQGGFEHNYNSLLVVDLLENPDRNKFEDKPYFGLNLTNYTRYGILHHTKANKYFYNTDEDDLMSDTNTYYSIEAELVAKVDTLTYLCHDFEDAIRMKVLTDMKEENEELYKKFETELKNILEESKFKEKYKYIYKEDLKQDKEDLKQLRTDLLLKYLCTDLIEGSAKEIEKIQSNIKPDVEYFKNFKDEKGKIIVFNKFKDHFDVFKKTINDYIYVSPLAQKMDTKARYIVEHLYTSFYKNPGQLPYKTKKMYDKALAGEFAYDDIIKDKGRKDRGYHLGTDRVICNFIAGMTDRYALELYETMFGGKY